MKALRVLFLGVVLAAASSSAANAYVPTPAVDEAVASINAIRASVGSCPLAIDPAVSDVAGGWSASNASFGRLFHNTGLMGTSSVWAENVGYGMNTAQVNDLFTRSPRHFANLTNPTFDAVGVGLAQAGPNTFVTYDFIGDGIETHC